MTFPQCQTLGRSSGAKLCLSAEGPKSDECEFPKKRKPQVQAYDRLNFCSFHFSYFRSDIMSNISVPSTVAVVVIFVALFAVILSLALDKWGQIESGYSGIKQKVNYSWFLSMLKLPYCIYLWPGVPGFRVIAHPNESPWAYDCEIFQNM